MTATVCVTMAAAADIGAVTTVVVVAMIVAVMAVVVAVVVAVGDAVFKVEDIAFVT